MDLEPLQLSGRFAAVSQSAMHCRSYVFPLQHLETWNSVNKLYMYLWLQCLCEGFESGGDIKGKSSKIGVETNGRVEKEKEEKRS